MNEILYQTPSELRKNAGKSLLLVAVHPARRGD